VDAGAGLSHDSTLPLGLADETLLVSTAERSALGDTEKTRQLTERLGGSVAGVAITRLDPATAADDRPVDAVAETLDVPVLGRIPEDDAVLRAVEAAQPLPVFAPDAPATRAYRDLTRALTGAAIDGLGLVDGSDAETEKPTWRRKTRIRPQAVHTPVRTPNARGKLNPSTRPAPATQTTPET